MSPQTEALLLTLARDRVQVLDALRAGRRMFEIVADTGAPFDARLDVAARIDKHRAKGDPPMMCFDKMMIDAGKEGIEWA
ncbi:MAG: hypothetical protein KAI80_01205 [Hyphomicrobiaceae bacterium]|nr:hypothetical protein [Hyphomicrobiaceae bacterium]